MAKVLTIRPYRIEDVPYMVERAADFIPKMVHYRNVKFSKERTEYLLRNNLNPQSGFGGWVLTDSEDTPRGFGAGYCVPAIISTDLVANDVILYVEPEWRSLKNADLLIAAYVEWATKKGAALIKATETSGMVGTDVTQETYDKFLARHGFERVGSVYHRNK